MHVPSSCTTSGIQFALAGTLQPNNSIDFTAGSVTFACFGSTGTIAFEAFTLVRKP